MSGKFRSFPKEENVRLVQNELAGNGQKTRLDAEEGRLRRPRAGVG